MRQRPLTPPLHGQIMRAHGVKNLVFSSSATVYGNPQYLPLDEAHPTGGCTNPYGKSKFFIEEMIRDLCQADKVRAPFDSAVAPLTDPSQPTPASLRMGSGSASTEEEAGVQEAAVTCTRSHSTCREGPIPCSFLGIENRQGGLWIQLGHTACTPNSHRLTCVPQAWNAVLLRYFNPIGAHASGCIGEDPQGIPNNLMPYVSQVKEKGKEGGGPRLEGYSWCRGPGKS